MLTLKKIIVLTLGLSIIGLGGSLFILSNIGSDPFNVLMQGLANVSGITVGQSNILVSAIYVFIIFFLDKKYLQVGTLIAVFLLGSMIDLGIHLLGPFFENNLDFIIRFCSMLVGCVLIAVGVATVYSAKIGMVANDGLTLILAEKLKMPFKWFRIGYDLSIVIVGILLGGIFGVGTIICALVTGPLIAFFMPRIASLSDKFIQTQ